MTLDPINPSNKVNITQKTSNIKKINSISTKDSVNISQEALSKAELKKYIKIVKETPEIRVDKVEIAKKNMQSYFKDGKIDTKILENIAHKIFSTLG